MCDYSNHGRGSEIEDQESLFRKEKVSCQVTDRGRLEHDVSSASVENSAKPTPETRTEKGFRGLKETALVVSLSRK